MRHMRTHGKTCHTVDEGIRDVFGPRTPLVAHFNGNLLPDNEGVNATHTYMHVVVSD